jgi:putative transposase
MPDYRRPWHPVVDYFFPVSLPQRHGNNLLKRHFDFLRDNVASMKLRHPFRIHGCVV